MALLLLSPICWTHYHVFLILPMAALFTGVRRDSEEVFRRLWGPCLRLTLGLYLLSVLAPFAIIGTFNLGTIFLWAYLCRRLRISRATQPAAAVRSMP